MQIPCANTHRLLIVAAILAALPTVRADSSPWELWYDQPAQEWVEALPLGNGHMGMMVFGGVPQARYQFNVDTVWTGGPHSYARKGAHKHLPQIRKLLFEGKQKEAEALAGREFMSQPLGQMAYQPLGDVELNFSADGQPQDYRRSLSLNQAATTTRYRLGDASYTRKVFASYPDRVIVLLIECDKPEGQSFTANLSSPHTNYEVSEVDKHTLLMSGRVNDVKNSRAGNPRGQIRFAAHLRCADSDGEVSVRGDQLHITGASRTILLLTGATNHVNFRDISANPVERSQQDLEQATKKTYDELATRHGSDFDELFSRVELNLEGQASELPTDDRILAAKESSDPQLAALLFHYGRYLLIASSRPGSQPANLQGVWNDQLSPPWDSKYTTNINAQMNYWPAEACNLGECAEPLFDALAELARSGAETAQEHYAARGWVLHHNFDLWRGTAPINASNHGIWPTGGAWLCQHLWWHYLYSGDEDFLRNRAYPLMKGAAKFFVDTLIEDPRSPEKWLISGPSNSPEQGGLVLGPAMDHQIIRELFANTSAAARILETDADFATQLDQMRERIAPDNIGKHGQLQEWLEDVDDPNNRHRHVSHLWALFPGNEITPTTADLFAAARKSLEMRGDGGTGWSLAWKINLWARLQDGDHAHKILDNLLTLTGSSKTDYDGGGVYPNLFDAHPPFQIDGNFGATSGICEMLLQSHQVLEDGTRVIELLPALPGAWPKGNAAGICTPDGFSVDIQWEADQLVHCRVHSTLGKRAVIRCAGKQRELTLAAGEDIFLDGDLNDAQQN